MTTESTGASRSGHTAGVFDIRLIIAALFGIYGVVLTVLGLVGTSPEDLAKSDGLNINLWGGVAMIVFAAAFVVWTKLRPIVVPEEAEEQSA